MNRGVMWLLLLVACSRRIEHFHGVDAGMNADGALDDAAAPDGGPVVCPQPLATPALACPTAGFGLPTALAGDGHVMARLADVNVDGKLDLISPEISRNRVAVAFGRGDGSFQAPAYYMTGSEPVSLDVGDLDGDGDRDIVIGAQATADLMILSNTGNGTFGAPSPLTVSKARTVAIASLNADTRPDLVVASSIDQTVSVVLATSTGYAAPTVYNLGFTVMAAATGDLDNDGDVDIVAVGSPNRKVTLTNTGAGAFTTTSSTLGSDGNDVAIADFDGDGLRDVAVAESTKIEIYTGSGLTLVAQNFLSPRGITSADVDGDGKPDFAVVGWAGLLILHWGPTGLAAAGYPIELPAQGPEQVTAGDFDGDGHVDLVASSVNNRDNGILVLRNSGAATFTPPVTVLGMGSTLSATLGDLNGDGRNDVVRVTPTSFEVWLQSVAGVLSTDGIQHPATGSVAIGDVTVDGSADIVVATPTSVEVFTGNGHGQFAHASSYPTGGTTSELYLADLSGNCAPEIVLVHPLGPAGSGGPHSETVSVMRNRGDGTFDLETVNSLPKTTSATVGDFDEDGKPDLIAAGAVPAQLGFFHGNGDATFSAAVTIAVTYPWQIASADINGDGHRDLIMSNLASVGMGYQLGTMRGHGDGTFDAPVYQPSLLLQTGNSMHVLDFDGDGRLDVVFRNEVGIGVHIGHPNGTFDPARIYSMPGTPLLIGDLDNDGRADSIGQRDVQNMTSLFGEIRGTCTP